MPKIDNAKIKMSELLKDIKDIRKKHAEKKINKLKKEIESLMEVNAKFLDKDLTRTEEHNSITLKLSEANQRIAELKAEMQIAYNSALNRTEQVVTLKNELNFLKKTKENDKKPSTIS